MDGSGALQSAQVVLPGESQQRSNQRFFGQLEQARRRLRQRCVWHGASRARVDGRLPTAGVLRRLFAEKGVGLFRQGARPAEEAVSGHSGRRQSGRQDPADPQSVAAGRRDDHWRRHGVYVCQSDFRAHADKCAFCSSSAVVCQIVDGHAIGSSLFDDEGAKIVAQLVAEAKQHDVLLHRPTDYVAADKFAADATTKVVTAAAGVPDGWLGLDIGPETTAAFVAVAKRAQTLVWNGPMGVFEMDAFASGTRGLLDGVVEATNGGAVTIIGGGDTATAAANFGCEDKVRREGGAGFGFECSSNKTTGFACFNWRWSVVGTVGRQSVARSRSIDG